MTKLVDQFGTCYFAAHYSSEVKNFLATCKEVDLAGARICRNVMEHVRAAASAGVVIHDTEDPERNAHFAENRRRRELSDNKPPTTPLPLPTTTESVIPTIKAMSPEKLYSIPNGRAMLNASFVFLVQAARPEIQIDLGNSVGEVLALIYDNLFPSSHRWDNFYKLVSPTFVMAQPPAGEYNNFIRDNIVVPADFGTKCLFTLPEWGYCINRISKLLDKRLNPKKRKIKDYL